MMNFNYDTKISEIIRLPEFSRFGNFLFPIQWGYSKDLKIKDVGHLLPYHSCVRKEVTLNVIETINQISKTQKDFFHDIYTDEEKRFDPSKDKTGLFFFKGEKNKPFAIICAGGGFSYVGSIHESFPHAIELSKRGYNAFVLHYRLGNANLACEDLAKAIIYIFEHQNELEVNPHCYSLWGGSAGARMAAYLGSLGTERFTNAICPRAGCVIMQYTGHSHYTRREPATYACVGFNDGIASWQTMQHRIQQLEAMGVDTEFHTYKNIGHGFGLGINTSAQGWFEDAVAFWDKQIKKGEKVK